MKTKSSKFEINNYFFNGEFPEMEEYLCNYLNLENINEVEKLIVGLNIKTFAYYNKRSQTAWWGKTTEEAILRSIFKVVKIHIFNNLIDKIINTEKEKGNIIEKNKVFTTLVYFTMFVGRPICASYRGNPFDVEYLNKKYLNIDYYNTLIQNVFYPHNYTHYEAKASKKGDTHSFIVPNTTPYLKDYIEDYAKILDFEKNLSDKFQRECENLGFREYVSIIRDTNNFLKNQNKIKDEIITKTKNEAIPALIPETKKDNVQIAIQELMETTVKENILER